LIFDELTGKGPDYCREVERESLENKEVVEKKGRILLRQN
jgi:hypothetical protein